MWASGKALFDYPNVVQVSGCLGLCIEYAYDVDEAIYFDTFTYSKDPASRRVRSDDWALNRSSL
jgi:hypothetical protein